MAYGNWGAWVYRGDEHMPSHEDQTPYDEETRTPGYHQVFERQTESCADPHHAVLGGRDVRLCGYKNQPRLLVRGAEVDLAPFKLDQTDRDPCTPWDETYEGWPLAGYAFRAVQFDGNMVDLLLIEPDGTEWRARCGYGYGAGIDDIPVNRCTIQIGEPA